jgi:hypothetical protein
VKNVVAGHLSRLNHGQDDKEAIEDKMRDDHLYRVLDKDTWMIDIIRAIRKMPLDHADGLTSGEDAVLRAESEAGGGVGRHGLCDTAALGWISGDGVSGMGAALR